MSAGFYPAQNYLPFFEFGGTRRLPLVLIAEYVNIVFERLAGLVETMCLNEHFCWRSLDKVFRMNSTESYRVARLVLDLFQTTRTAKSTVHILHDQESIVYIHMHLEAFKLM